MVRCRGINDWLACLSCPYICTKMCPIEREDAIEEMKRQMRLSSVSDIAEGRENGGREHHPKGYQVYLGSKSKETKSIQRSAIQKAIKGFRGMK